MGYRSEVAFCLRVKEPEKFIALVKVNSTDVIREMLNNMYYFEDHLDNRYIMFKHSYWKWYDDSESAFADLMNLAESYDPEFACRFARSGENFDDVVEETFGDGNDLDYPYIVKAVECGALDEDLDKIIKEEDHAATS